MELDNDKMIREIFRTRSKNSPNLDIQKKGEKR